MQDIIFCSIRSVHALLMVSKAKSWGYSKTERCVSLVVLSKTVLFCEISQNISHVQANKISNQGDLNDFASELNHYTNG